MREKTLYKKSTSSFNAQRTRRSLFFIARQCLIVKPRRNYENCACRNGERVSPVFKS